ncbi:PepSY domain-containing protein [Salinisphaera dokdonensis]
MRLLFLSTIFCLLVAIGAVSSVGVLKADDSDAADARAARRALDAGEIRPFGQLLAQVERDCRGRFVEMELEEDDGRWIYEIKMLGPQGDVAELEYDAADLRLLEAEGKRLGALECVPPGTPD